MKKTMKWLAVAMAVVMLCMTLVACAKTLSGTYSAELDLAIAGGKTSYTFSGSKVTVSVTNELFGKSETKEYTGKYEITEAEDGSMTIALTFENADAKSYTGSYSFAETETGIKIGMIEYTKQ